MSLLKYLLVCSEVRKIEIIGNQFSVRLELMKKSYSVSEFFIYFT